MCGFIGTISEQPGAQEAFNAGLADLVDRGITINSYQEGSEYLGYVRLPTDDVDNTELGKRLLQGSSRLLFNGLITNLADLARKYQLPEQVLQSDTLCVRYGLTHYGAGFLRYCRGMFALALSKDDEILLARDGIGIKPLYYVHTETVFAFTSEIKALMHFGESIQTVLPGQIIRYQKSTKRLSKQTYTYKSTNQTYSTADLEYRLTEAVVMPTRRYLRQITKDVAILLSGGVDSSIIAQLLANNLRPEEKRRIRAFCVGEVDSADVRNATRLAASLGLRLVHVPPYNASHSLSQLDRIVYDVESPYSRVVKVALLYDAIAAAIKREGIDVVLGGEGADELFFGYHRFIDGLTHAQSQVLFGHFYERIFHYTLLQRYDRVFARRQIEGRVPFLDQEVVAVAARIRSEDKIHHLPVGHISKVPLRILAKRIGLPAYIYERPKEKMTQGATGRHNSSDENGYLEQEAAHNAGVSFDGLVRASYQKHFFHNARAALAWPEDFFTEEDAMQLVQKYKIANELERQL